MVKRFFQEISKNFCIYLLGIANLIHAIQTHCFDWLLWVSLILCGVSVVLSFLCAYRGGETG